MVQGKESPKGKGTSAATLSCPVESKTSPESRPNPDLGAPVRSLGLSGYSQPLVSGNLGARRKEPQGVGVPPSPPKTRSVCHLITSTSPHIHLHSSLLVLHLVLLWDPLHSLHSPSASFTQCFIRFAHFALRSLRFSSLRSSLRSSLLILITTLLVSYQQQQLPVCVLILILRGILRSL